MLIVILVHQSIGQGYHRIQRAQSIVEE